MRAYPLVSLSAATTTPAGALCDIDLITWELHPESADIKRWMRSPKGPSLFAAVLNRTDPADRTDGFHSPSKYLLRPSRWAEVDRRLPAGCGVRFVEKDDETYLLARDLARRQWEPSDE